jgi:hypothetical protein
MEISFDTSGNPAKYFLPLVHKNVFSSFITKKKVTGRIFIIIYVLS